MDWGNVRMANLVKYLESIQAGPDPTGAQLFGQYCAACHGNDLKGTGSAPEPYTAPPDLTTLAKRNGGTFPETHVLDILRNGVVIPAHGLADMPAWGTDSRLMDISNPGQVSQRINALVAYAEANRAARRLGLKRLFLHAASLSFRWPGEDRSLVFEADLDPDLQYYLDGLETPR